MAGYTVRDLNNCKLISGTIPVRDLLGLLGAWPADWQSDDQLAKALHVGVVCGAPADLQAWRQQLGLDEEKP